MKPKITQWPKRNISIPIISSQVMHDSTVTHVIMDIEDIYSVMGAPAVEIVTMKIIKNDLNIRSKYERCSMEHLFDNK